jgi:hypothetical protein
MANASRGRVTRASQGDVLWTACTEGEEVFQVIHRALASGIDVTSSTRSVDLDCLGSQESFTEFVRISATLDVFMRCMLLSRDFENASGSQGNIGDLKVALVRMDLPSSVYGDSRFLENLRLAGRTAAASARDMPKHIRKRLEAELSTCYMCGKILIKDATGDRIHAKRTVDHLWPLCFGGQTSFDNLLSACHKCNGARGPLLSWAAGPVYRTFWKPARDSDKPQNPDIDVTISLGLARLMDRASGKSSDSSRPRTPMTLKKAALSLGPIRPTLRLQDRYHTYFDMLTMSREST